MNSQFRLIGEKILETKYEIARNVHEDRLADIILTQEKKQLKKAEKAIMKIRADFINLFGETLHKELDQNASFEMVSKWGKESGDIIFSMNAPLDEALKDLRYYRRWLWKTIRGEAIKFNMPLETVFEISDIIDPLLDHAAYSFSLTYVDHYKKTLENAKTAFIELSVPIVPIKKEIAILPLVGNIDTERAQLLMEKALNESKKLQLSYLVLDLSGVMIIDTMVADQIFKVISALQLIGVETILTGIRPEIAQTMVNLGIDFNDLSIKNNLEQALVNFNS